MAQFKIKQVRELQTTLDAITGIDTVTEAYTTTATDGPTGVTITYSCRETDNAQVYVNGVRINLGDYGWREGTTDVTSNTELNAGAEFVWNSSAIGFDLANDDEIEIIYETGIPVTTGGSVGSGSNGDDGTSGTSGTSGLAGASGTSGVNGAAGNDGTSGTSGVNGADGTSGTSGTTNSNATGLTLTSPSGIIYTVGVDDAGNLTTTNSGTAGTSGSSSGSGTGPGGLTGTTLRILGTVDEMNMSSPTDPFDSLGQTETYSNTYDWIIRNIDPVNIGGITSVNMTQGTVDSPYIWTDNYTDEYALPLVGDTIYRDEDGVNYFEPGGFLWYDIQNGDKNTISDYGWVTVGANGVVTSAEVLQMPSITSTNLIAHLDASDTNSYSGAYSGSGEWPWYDLTGNGHTGKVNPVIEYDANVAGGAYEWLIDGTINESILWNESTSISQFSPWVNPNQTIQMWVYLPDNSPVQIFKKQNLGNAGWNLTFNNNSSKDWYTINVNGYGQGPYTPSSPGTNMDGWNLITIQFKDAVTASFDGNDYVGWRIFVNDTVVSTPSANADGFTVANPTTTWSTVTQETESLEILTTNNTTGSYEYTGKAGAFYFYNRILTPQEVADNYNNTKSRFGL